MRARFAARASQRGELWSIVPLPPVTWAVSVRSAARKSARGGDVFEACMRQDGAIAVLMADLWARGDLAERQSEAIRTVFTRSVEDQRRPAAILAALNGLKLESPESGAACATAFVATFDAGSRSMTYASAGHDFALISGQHSHRHLATTGPRIGVRADPLFAERYEPLGVDDLLVLVTDGVAECRHIDEEEVRFGTSRIVRALKCAGARAPRAAHDAIVRSLDEFAGGCYRDDATTAVLAVR